MYIHIYIYTYILVHICVYLCIFVYVLIIGVECVLNLYQILLLGPRRCLDTSGRRIEDGVNPHDMLQPSLGG